MMVNTATITAAPGLFHATVPTIFVSLGTTIPRNNNHVTAERRRRKTSNFRDHSESGSVWKRAPTLALSFAIGFRVSFERFVDIVPPPPREKSKECPTHS